MKKAIAITALLVGTLTPANADVYVKVDANGNAVDNAILCDAVTCGDSSEYSRLTLKEGERYVLQGYGDAGIGNNNPNTAVKVDIPTQTWTVINTQTEQVERIFTPQADLTPVFVMPVETSTSTMDSTTVVSDTATVTVETSTATSESTTFEALYAQIMALLTRILALIAKLNG